MIRYLRTIPPDGDVAAQAAKLANWLGCYRERVTDMGWDGLVFDRGVVADTTGATSIRRLPARAAQAADLAATTD